MIELIINTRTRVMSAVDIETPNINPEHLLDPLKNALHYLVTQMQENTTNIQALKTKGFTNQ